MKTQSKVLRSGINSPLICRKCGHKMGYVRMRSRLKWKQIGWTIGLALLFEIIANIVVYLIFKGLN